jgi:hypothetical protein
MAGALGSGIGSIEFALTALEGFVCSPAEALDAASRLNQVIDRLQLLQRKLEAGGEIAGSNAVPVANLTLQDSVESDTSPVTAAPAIATPPTLSRPMMPRHGSQIIDPHQQAAAAASIHTAAEIEMGMVEKARKALEKAAANANELKHSPPSIVTRGLPSKNPRAILPIDEEGEVAVTVVGKQRKSVVDKGMNFFRGFRDEAANMLNKAGKDIRDKVNPDWSSDRRGKLTDKERAAVKKAFEAIDVNGDGSLALEELYSVLACMGIKPTVHELHALMAEFDVDGDGSIGEWAPSAASADSVDSVLDPHIA